MGRGPAEPDWPPLTGDELSAVRSPRNADLAYDGYLIGHARWFGGPEGQELLGLLESYPPGR